MKKEKESWTLLWVWTAYLPVKEIKWEFYVKVSDFTRCMDSIRIEQETDRKYIEELEEENKNLNIKVASLEWEIKWLNSVIEKLHKEIEEQEAEWHWLFDEIDYRKRECKKLNEKVRFLEECLDRKEKLNEKYRKEIEELKSTYVYDAKQVRDIC